MAIGKPVILPWFSRRENWGAERVNNPCRVTAVDHRGLAKIHAHRGGVYMMGLGYFLVSYGREVLTAKSLSPISVEYPSPKDLLLVLVAALLPLNSIHSQRVTC